MAKEYSRTQRVADQVQKELAQLIQLEMKDPRLGMVTVSAVKVSRDMSFADVYVSFLGVDDQENIDQSVQVSEPGSGLFTLPAGPSHQAAFYPTAALLL